MNLQELATKIKNKFPKAKELSDERAVELFLKKHPNLKLQEKPKEEPEEIKEEIIEEVTNRIPGKFFFITEFGEICDLASYLEFRGNEVRVMISDVGFEKIGDGFLTKEKEWYRYLGQDYIWIFDGCSNGDMQDWLRENGEVVIGGTKESDELENNRQMNQEWFRELGFNQPFSQNFTDIDEAIQFVTDNIGKRYILKQNGSAPKSINYIGKFDNNEDMLFHLEELKRGWNESEYGKFDCDLMEVVEGMEVGASVFFNGHDFLRNLDGKIVGYLNWEEKKEVTGGLGETCGEMGTTFLGVTEDNNLFREIICLNGIREKLSELNYHGVFDINCIVNDDGIVALEPTTRFGVPATSYEFIEGLKDTEGVLEAMARGYDVAIENYQGWGIVMVVAAKPFPLESNIDEQDTSLGEKLWLLNELDPKHLHLYNFQKNETGYRVCTKSGYLLTVTSVGDTIKEARKNCIKYINDNLYISGQKWRTDIGKRVEKEYENNY